MAKKKSNFTIYVIALIGLFVLLDILANRGGAASNFEGNPTEVNAEDWTKGNSEAKVTLIEYGDFQCPACSAYQAVLKEMQSKYGSSVNFVYRHFPLTQIHPHALPAARASEAAGKQGKFWEMHDILYEKQNFWSAGHGSPDGFFVSYAEELGLDIDQFTSDYSNTESRDAVLSDLSSANKLKLNSTPSFLLNGELIQAPGSSSGFSALLEEAIVANGGIVTPDINYGVKSAETTEEN